MINYGSKLSTLINLLPLHVKAYVFQYYYCSTHHFTQDWGTSHYIEADPKLKKVMVVNSMIETANVLFSSRLLCCCGPHIRTRPLNILIHSRALLAAILTWLAAR